MNIKKLSLAVAGALFVGGSRVEDEITCKNVQIPIAPKAIPLQVNPDLVK